MAESLRFQSDQTLSSEKPDFLVDYMDAPAIDVSAFQTMDVSEAELATCSPAYVRLDLEELNCFDVVDRQFQKWGVTFANAIALHPSNPAYPPRSGMIVLMGSPRSGWLEATFRHPVQFVSGFITSSKRTTLRAFDANNQPLGQIVSSGANLAGSDSDIQPNVQLSLKAENIHRITFHTFDGHLTLDDFSFGF